MALRYGGINGENPVELGPAGPLWMLRGTISACLTARYRGIVIGTASALWSPSLVLLGAGD